MPYRLNSLLDSNQNLRNLSQRVRQIAALQQLYLSIAPPTLRQASSVIRIQGTTLILSADNGAVAAKLRQIGPDLISLFLTRGCEITGIQIRVQVRNTALTPRSTPRKIGKEGRIALEELVVKLPDSPLKTRLQRLAKRNA